MTTNLNTWLPMVLLLCSQAAFASDLVGVVHPYNLVESLEDKTLKKMYLGNIKSWGQGESLTVYLRSPRSDAGATLFDEVLNMPEQRYTAYWDRRQLSGQDIKPKELKAIGEILAVLEREPGAFTVVSIEEAEALPPNLVRLVRLGERSLPADRAIKSVDWAKPVKKPSPPPESSPLEPRPAPESSSDSDAPKLKTLKRGAPLPPLTGIPEPASDAVDAETASEPVLEEASDTAPDEASEPLEAASESALEEASAAEQATPPVPGPVTTPDSEPGSDRTNGEADAVEDPELG